MNNYDGDEEADLSTVGTKGSDKKMNHKREINEENAKFCSG